MTDKHTPLVERLEALRLFLSGVGDLDGLSFGEPKAISPTRQGLFWWRRSHLPVITEAATRITALEAREAELVEALHWREEALRHAQGRFLNINIALSSGGTKREAIGIADVGEDCCKMALAREELPVRIRIRARATLAKRQKGEGNE